MLRKVVHRARKDVDIGALIVVIIGWIAYYLGVGWGYLVLGVIVVAIGWFAHSFIKTFVQLRNREY